MKSSVLAIVAVATGLVVGGGNRERQSVDCPESCVTSGAHIITTRGSLEPPGPGMMGLLSDKIAASCTGSDAEVSWDFSIF